MASLHDSLAYATWSYFVKQCLQIYGWVPDAHVCYIVGITQNCLPFPNKLFISSVVLLRLELTGRGRRPGEEQGLGEGGPEHVRGIYVYVVRNQLSCLRRFPRTDILETGQEGGHLTHRYMVDVPLHNTISPPPLNFLCHRVRSDHQQIMEIGSIVFILIQLCS